MFALVDANAFYCSAEQVFRPEWRDKPIVVLSNNDGCVVAANRLARAVGIAKFKPYFEVKALCELHHVIALSSNYELYADLSAKMMNVIGRFAPEQHIYSIDESFLSFQGCQMDDFVSHGMQIRRAVWKECRLPVCVGIGPTVTLAKVANHAAKKILGYHGVCYIGTEPERIRILKLLHVSDVWGIGRRLSARMKLMGINTAYDLSVCNPGQIKRHFSIEIERTVRELNGQSCKTWDSSRADKKQIFSTRSVSERITDTESLHQSLCMHAAIAGRKARQQHSLCKTMLCFANSSPFDQKPYQSSVVHQFPFPTSDTNQLMKAAGEATKQLFRPGVRFYKIGVGFVELLDNRFEQLDWTNLAPNNPRLMHVFDGINQQYGDNTVIFAAQGINQKWQMRRELLTPQYSTRWQDLPVIKS